MLGDPVWKAIFAPNGTLLEAGDLIRRTNYSRTLATIASEGADAFYKKVYLADMKYAQIRFLMHYRPWSFRVRSLMPLSTWLNLPAAS